MELVKIEEKKIEAVNGMKLLVQILKDEEYKDGYVSLRHTYELLGMSKQAMHNLFKRNQHLEFVNVSCTNYISLRNQGVIPLTGSPGKFVSKDTFKQIVKLVDTPEAEAIYNALWVVVERAAAHPTDMFDGLSLTTRAIVDHDIRISNVEQRVTFLEKPKHLPIDLIDEEIPRTLKEIRKLAEFAHLKGSNHAWGRKISAWLKANDVRTGKTDYINKDRKYIGMYNVYTVAQVRQYLAYIKRKALEDVDDTRKRLKLIKE